MGLLQFMLPPLMLLWFRTGHCSATTGSKNISRVILTSEITIILTLFDSQWTYLDTEEQGGPNVHWLGIAVGARLPTESQVHSGNGRKSWNDWAQRDANSSENLVLDPARVRMRLLTRGIKEKTNILFNLSQREVMAFFKIMTMFAHCLHSVVPGNQDGTGRCSSLWFPNSLHGCCRNSVCKRLHTYRERVHMHIINILKSVISTKKQTT